MIALNIGVFLVCLTVALLVGYIAGRRSKKA